MKKYLLLFMILFCAFCLNTDAATLVKTDSGYKYTRHDARKGEDALMSETLSFYQMDGKVSYCIDPGIHEGTNNYVEGSMADLGLSSDVQERVMLTAYYGYTMPSHGTTKYRVATQALIWEAVMGNDSYVNFSTDYWNNGTELNVDREKSRINSLINYHYVLPSFINDSYEINIGESIVLKDDNGVLNNFNIEVENGEIDFDRQMNLVVTSINSQPIKLHMYKVQHHLEDFKIFTGNGIQSMIVAGKVPEVSADMIINVKGGTVSLEKLDSVTQGYEPMGESSLSGAVYGIYDANDTLVSSLETNGEYPVKSSYLPDLGTYYLKEEKSSYGYELDPNKYYFEVSKNNLNVTVTVFENAIKKNVNIYKMYADDSTTILKGEKNARFEFYLKKNMKLYASGTTDKEGKLQVKLPYGTYIVKQVSGEEGYELIKDFEIVIDENTNEINKILTDAKVRAKLKVVKVDADSGNIIVRDGFKFKIKNLSTNEYVCQSITYPYNSEICEYETKDGVFVTPYLLESDDYEIEEIRGQNINKYLWNDEKIKFSINKESIINDKEIGPIVIINFKNKQVMGEFELYKYGEKFVIDSGTFHYEDELLDDVSFDLYAGEDIYSGDGSLIYKTNEKIKSFNTKDGYYKLSNLYLGKYYLVETNVSDKYVLNDEPYYFELEYIDENTSIVNKIIELKNYLKKGSVKLVKIEDIITMPVSGALINVYTLDDELIFSGRTGIDGTLTIKDLPLGKYKYREIEAPEGFNLDPKEYFFEVETESDAVTRCLLNSRIQVPDTGANDSLLHLVGQGLIGGGGVVLNWKGVKEKYEREKNKEKTK